MKEIIVDKLENCSGCLLCSLACSFFTGKKEFNPSEAKINIRRKNKENRYSVNFLEECTQCGLCVNYCHYGVLSTR